MIDLTVADAASLLRVSEKTIYRWIQKKSIPAYKIGGQYRFRRQELLAWAGSRRIVVTAGSLSEGSAAEMPFTLWEALEAGGIYYRIGGSSKREVIENAVHTLHLPERVNRDYVLRELLLREDMSSTAVGDGIALPHIHTPITPDLPHPFVALLLLEQPVDFAALDGQPVTAMVIVLSPSVRTHLHLMSLLSFVLREPRTHEVIKSQASRSDIIEAVRQAEEHLASETEEAEERVQARFTG